VVAVQIRWLMAGMVVEPELPGIGDGLMGHGGTRGMQQGHQTSRGWCMAGRWSGGACTPVPGARFLFYFLFDYVGDLCWTLDSANRFKTAS
jgi:hypothetical protein